MAFKVYPLIGTILMLYLNTFGYADGSAKIIQKTGTDGIRDEFLIVLKKSDVHKVGNAGKNSDWVKFENNLFEKTSLTIKHIIAIGNFKAVVVKTNIQKLEGILDDTDIDYIEMNQKIRLFMPPHRSITSTSQPECITQNTGSDIWGLSRLNQKGTLDVDSSFTYSWMTDESGSGVHAYVVDTGIYLKNFEFEGRASHGYTSKSIAQVEDDKDYHGHGTHVAGTIGGKTTGVAKGVHLVAVKVLASNGEGSITDVLQGLEFVYKDHKKRKSHTHNSVKSVVNMSLGAQGSAPVMEEAVEALIEEGIPVVVAAGNDYNDACGYTPARVDVAITVGATNINDEMTYFSNYGTCVDILAPGSNILSAFKQNPNSMAYASGTSMAAPHVTGVVATYLSQWKGDDPLPGPSEIKTHLLNTAAADKLNLNIGGVGSTVQQNTPNLLLNTEGCS